MPNNIDMDLIQEAMMRRRSGDIPMEAPQGMETPQSREEVSPATPAVEKGRGVTNEIMGVNSALQASQALKENPKVDNETQMIAKVLITKLLKLL